MLVMTKRSWKKQISMFLMVYLSISVVEIYSSTVGDAVDHETFIVK